MDPKDDTVCFRSWDGEKRNVATKMGGKYTLEGGESRNWGVPFFLQKGIKRWDPLSGCFFLFGGGGKKRE